MSTSYGFNISMKKAARVNAANGFERLLRKTKRRACREMTARLLFAKFGQISSLQRHYHVVEFHVATVTKQLAYVVKS